MISNSAYAWTMVHVISNKCLTSNSIFRQLVRIIPVKAINFYILFFKNAMSFRIATYKPDWI